MDAEVEGNLARNVLQRLDEVVQSRLDVLTVVAGTNDVQAAASPAGYQMYRRQQGITHPLSLKWHLLENIHAIPARLTNETSACVALMTIRPLGRT